MKVLVEFEGDGVREVEVTAFECEDDSLLISKRSSIPGMPEPDWVRILPDHDVIAYFGGPNGGIGYTAYRRPRR